MKQPRLTASESELYQALLGQAPSTRELARLFGHSERQTRRLLRSAGRKLEARGRGEIRTEHEIFGHGRYWALTLWRPVQRKLFTKERRAK